MHKMKPKTATITLLAFFTLMVLAGLSTSNVSATGGAIAKANCYPQDEGTYDSVNYFLYQLTSINANTTISISIDGAKPIPLIYQGLKSETISGDTTPTEWYTWQTAVPAITGSGKHTFQFFSHYFVWQGTDKYWAEFNSYSDIHSFNIGSDQSVSSASLDPILTTSALPQISAITQGALYAVLASAVVVVVASVTLGCRGLAKRNHE